VALLRRCLKRVQNATTVRKPDERGRRTDGGEGERRASFPQRLVTTAFGLLVAVPRLGLQLFHQQVKPSTSRWITLDGAHHYFILRRGAKK